MHEEPVVQVNGERLPWQPGEHVASVLDRLQTPAHSVATALNGHFIPRTLRETTPLQPGDVLTVFKAIVGG